ncbi:MAG: U32 family peptidase [archaeon]
MEKPELLLPAGNIECLRAAVNNGADAVYLGLQSYNARRKAGNFTEGNLFSAVKYCHNHNVRVYVTLNILIKNQELNSALNATNIVAESKADALIIQDPCLVPVIKKHHPNLSLHMSTQATVTNSRMVPDGIDRVILARELNINQIKKISERHETEVFVHGALCVSYSGQCLFSSVVGGRSGNRGLCAQPCRKKYNNSYLLSTKDLCLLERLPEIAKAGVGALKVEGRLRTPLYVATVARIYRRYLDKLDNWQGVDKSDMELLKVVFSREFTEGFMFADKITDRFMPMNRGLFLGKVRDSVVRLRHPVAAGDGIALRFKDKSTGRVLDKINVTGSRLPRERAKAGDTVSFGRLKDGTLIYKTSHAGLAADLGNEVQLTEKPVARKEFSFDFREKEFNEQKIIVRAHNLKSALEADKSGCDIIYYDLMQNDFGELQGRLKNAELFADTPHILFDEDLPGMVEIISQKRPKGIVIGNRGLLQILRKNGLAIHLDYSFNVFNDIDIDYYHKFAIPVISPELSLADLKQIKNKCFISLVHGRLRIMTLKEKLLAPELVDESGRHFEVMLKGDTTQIINSKELGLFNNVKYIQKIGIRYFLIDTKDPGKYVRIYRKILSGSEFDDKRIRKGYTTGHFLKSVA